MDRKQAAVAPVALRYSEVVAWEAVAASPEVSNDVCPDLRTERKDTMGDEPSRWVSAAPRKEPGTGGGFKLHESPLVSP